ncbi:MAG: hypothetical protein WC863_04855 [Patescibacteria group bacterium]
MAVINNLIRRPSISAKGLSRQAVFERMTPCERSINQRLIKERGFDVIRLVTDGCCPVRFGKQELLFNMFECFHNDYSYGYPPYREESFDVAVNLLSLTEMAHLGCFAFRISVTAERIMAKAEGQRVFVSTLNTLHGQSVYNFFHQHFTIEDGKIGYDYFVNGEALFVKEERRKHGFGESLYGLAAFLAGRVYLAETLAYSTYYHDAAEAFYLHILEKAGVIPQTTYDPRRINDLPVTRFLVPLQQLDGLLGLLLD